MSVDLRLDVVLSSDEEVVEFENVEEGAEDTEFEDEVGVGDWEGVRAGGEIVSMGLNLVVRGGNTLVSRDLKLPGFA